MDAETERMNQTWQAAPIRISTRAQQNAASGNKWQCGNTDSSTAAEDVTDVEYEEVDDKVMVVVHNVLNARLWPGVVQSHAQVSLERIRNLLAGRGLSLRGK